MATEAPSATVAATDGHAPLFDVRDLKVHFPVRGGRPKRTAKALDGVTVHWKHDEILGVVGESGCGKSTLARAMLGLVKPTAGTIAVDGVGVKGKGDLRRLRRRVQMIFQDPYQTLNPRNRVRTIVNEPLLVHGIDRSQREARVSKALVDAGMDPERFLDRYPHELSGGQRQRVAIAAALVLEPEGMVCDEPVSMLDVSVRAQILQVLMELRRRRDLAILFITHDLGLAWALCDRIAVMYLGRIIEEGTAEEVIESPRHPYTQSLVSVVPTPKPRADLQRQILEGELPDASMVPSGCRFHPRCPQRFDRCDGEDPTLYEAGGTRGHRAACFLLDK